jgi:hypothetical protein
MLDRLRQATAERFSYEYAARVAAQAGPRGARYTLEVVNVRGKVSDQRDYSAAYRAACAEAKREAMQFAGVKATAAKIIEIELQ